MPFPVSDPYMDQPFPDIPSWPKRPKGNETGFTDGYSGDVSKQGSGRKTGMGTGTGTDGDGQLPLDVNFYFFLFW
jgi:hypothetical protein